MMMSEKQYFKVEYDEEWYLFDSTRISEQLVKEQAEYGYGVFANSLSPSEIVDLLNELFEENGELRKKLREDIAFKDKHISYFQNLIGDIEIEFKLKENLSKEKWEEIHEKNYQNFRFGSGDNE